MASVEQIKDAILEVAGNPESGAIYSLAPEMAEAVANIDNPKSTANPRGAKPKREIRVTEPSEVR